MAPAEAGPGPLIRTWRLATSGGVPRRSFKVALVVGTALNLINQGDALLGGGAIDWGKVVLTFMMPYAVSTYGAVSARWDGPSGGHPPGEAGAGG
jgi:hypothetical protein